MGVWFDIPCVQELEFSGGIEELLNICREVAVDIPLPLDVLGVFFEPNRDVIESDQCRSNAIT
eukprot:3935417-Amphidinium_carterae.4